MTDAKADPGATAAETKKPNLWDVEVQESDEKAWGEKSPAEKAWTVFSYFFRLCAVLGLLYLFIVSLGTMGDAFQIIAGPTAGEVFRNNEIFDNPIAGLVIGILATVLVQSSSTSTSIIISMTASNLMEVKNAIPMIMGANIGTSVTNTIVSVFQVGDKNQYRRAFAGATVHDCFNILTVIILLPIEAIFGMLRELAEAIIGDGSIDSADDVDFIKELTDPVKKRIVSVDKKLVTKVAEAQTQEKLDELLEQSMIKQKRNTGNHFFLDTGLSDQAAGWMLLFVALVILSTCLLLLVKVLQSVFKGRFAIGIKFLLNLELPIPYVADYVLILFGVGMTILMQSSSVTTSTLTPLVGIGLVRLEKMFCFTVGANIGTTVTGILSALASDNINLGMKVALSHLFFNLIGTAIWFPIPIVRSLPLNMAKGLGSIAADWKWFPIAYIVFAFGAVPGLLLALSVAHWAALMVFLILAVPPLVGLLVILALRVNYPDRLPEYLKKDPQLFGRSVLPPCLMMSPPAEEESEFAQTGDNVDGKGGWWLAPIVWGPKWLIICFLMVTVFNHKWADIKHYQFDSRDHFGFGTWSTCSKLFEENASWAPAPESMNACKAHWVSCGGQDWSTACAASGYSDVKGQEESYWAIMEDCTGVCSMQDWLQLCLDSNCGGSLHATQCRNVSEEATRPYTLEYVTSGGRPWVGGEHCRSDLLCNNDSDLMHTGNLAVAGFFFVCIAQLLFFVRGLVPKAHEQNMLIGILALDVLAWVLLLASWANFVSLRGADTECIVAVPGDHGYAKAIGTFDDVINTGGGYTFYMTVGAWVLLTLPISLITLKLMGWGEKAVVTHV